MYLLTNHLSIYMENRKEDFVNTFKVKLVGKNFIIFQGYWKSSHSLVIP